MTTTATLADYPRRRAQGLGEEIANAVSHGIGALLAIAALVVMLVRAARYGSALTVCCVALYGASMILLFLISCLYHALALPRGKGVFQVLDHCSIFLLIFGTYLPVTLLMIGGWVGWTMFGVIGAGSVLGVILNSISLSRWHKLSQVLYLILGWMALLSFPILWQKLAPPAFALLFLGGAAYTLGVIFYRKKERRYWHFVWHLFVLAGAMAHFFLIFNYACYLG